MKKNIRFYFAMFMSKTARTLQRMLKMNASYFPGKLAIKLCPDFLGRIDKPETIISVTGTNGKTTVCNMIIDALEKNGYDVLSNRAGSNINAGVASALIAESTMTGKAKKKIAVLEVDERSSKLIYPYIKPTYAVCTNLFRDSIHRNANPEFIFDFINTSLPKESHMILNADDLISCNLGEQNEKTYFSINRLPSDREESINLINDVRICPKCHNKLHYNYVRYHHIGNAVCDVCGYASPEGDYKAQLDMDNMTMTINHNGKDEEYHMISNSIFNTYNQVTAITVLREFGMPYDKVKESFAHLDIVESRYSKETVNGIDVITHMSKGQNPIACSCVFDYVGKEPGKKELILLLDDVFDRRGSSENMTWIWDCDFEFLNSPDITNIVIAGVRTADYKLRLLMAGVPEEKLQETEDEPNSPDLLKLEGTDSVYVLHELYAADTAMKVRDRVVERIKAKGGKV
jgi:UDP-N-acetylmuramyl tripeptide synthase